MASLLQRRELGLAPEDRLRDEAGERLAVVKQIVGLLAVESLRHWRRAGEVGEAAGDQQRVGAEFAHGREQRPGAGIEADAFGIDAVDGVQPQALEQRDAFAQGGANSISPRMARSVIAAICGFSPAMSASSSRHSQVMMVESMSAMSSFLRRFSLRTTFTSTGWPAK